MLKALTFGCYCPGRSLLHRSDPRTKILLTLLFMVTTFVVQNLATLLLLFLVAFGTAGIVGKPLRQSLRGLKPILYLAGVTVVVNFVSIKGAPLVDWPVVGLISREALLLSARMVLRLALLATSAALLTFTTTPLSLANGLERLLKPLGRLGLPTADLAMLFMLALRFMPLVVAEAQQQISALGATSPTFNRGHPLQRLRGYELLLVNLFAAVVARGDAMATAMESRCYRGSGGRTMVSPLAFTGADSACIGYFLALLSLLIGVESWRANLF